MVIWPHSSLGAGSGYSQNVYHILQSGIYMLRTKFILKSTGSYFLLPDTTVGDMFFSKEEVVKITKQLCPRQWSRQQRYNLPQELVFLVRIHPHSTHAGTSSMVFWDPGKKKKRLSFKSHYLKSFVNDKNKKCKKILALSSDYDIFHTFLRSGRNRNGWYLERRGGSRICSIWHFS